MTNCYDNQTVRHNGTLAKVDHADFFTGKIILRKFWNDGTYWAADMKDLEPVDEAPVTACQHKEGLVCFG